MRIELTDYLLSIYEKRIIDDELANRILNLPDGDFKVFLSIATEKCFDLIPSLRAELSKEEIIFLIIENLKKINSFGLINIEYYEKRYSVFFIDQETEQDLILPAYEDLFLNYDSELLDIKVLSGLSELYLGDLERITPERAANMRKLREVLCKRKPLL